MPDISDCLRQLMAIAGALGATLVDYPSGSSFGSAGRGAGGPARVDASGAAHLVRAAIGAAAPAAPGRPDRVEDIVVTAGSGYHLLHVPPCGPAERLALYLWLDRARGNLAMGQRSLRLIGDSLAGGPDAVAGRADLLAGRVDSAGGRVASLAGRAVESAR